MGQEQPDLPAPAREVSLFEPVAAGTSLSGSSRPSCSELDLHHDLLWVWFWPLRTSAALPALLRGPERLACSIACQSPMAALFPVRARGVVVAVLDVQRLAAAPNTGARICRRQAA